MYIDDTTPPIPPWATDLPYDVKVALSEYQTDHLTLGIWTIVAHLLSNAPNSPWKGTSREKLMQDFDMQKTLSAELINGLAAGDYERVVEEGIGYFKSQEPSRVDAQLRALRTSPSGRMGLEDANYYAWVCPYQGNAAQRLYALIKEICTTQKLCVGTADERVLQLPIIQSSGTGKSRCVDELAKRVFTFPLNIRDPKGMGYPLPDDPPRKYFETYIYDGTHKVIMKAVVRAFIAGFIMTGRNHLIKAFGTNTPANLGLSEEQVAYKWYDYLLDNRNEFYMDVVSVALNHLKPYLELDLSQDVRIKLPRPMTIEEIDPLSPSLKSKADKLDDELTKLISSETQALQRALGSTGRTIIFYIDEAHCFIEFCRRLDKQRYYTALDALSDVLAAEFRNTGIFTIYLSTSLDILSHLPPTASTTTTPSLSRKMTPSHPLQVSLKETIPMLPTFSALSFDCYPRSETHPIVEGTLMLKDVCEIPFLVRYGRPLFWSLYDAFLAEDERSSAYSIITCAQRKLVFSYELNKSLSEDAWFAVFSIRLLLEFDPIHHKASDVAMVMESRQVSNHLRLIYSPPQIERGCLTMHTGASSEPLLAEAAARAMEADRAGFPSLRPIYHLDFALRGLDDGRSPKSTGKRVALVARFLLNEAHDAAVRKYDWTSVNADSKLPKSVAPPLEKRNAVPSFTRPVKVVDLLEALIAGEWLGMVLDSHPVTPVDDARAQEPQNRGVTLREAFKDAYVNYTHFMRVSDDDVAFTAATAWMALARACGWQCSETSVDGLGRHDGTGVVHIVIPVFFAEDEKKPTAKLGRKSVSAIFVRVHARDYDSYSSTVPGRGCNSAKEESFFEGCGQTPGEEENRHPYIVLDMRFSRAIAAGGVRREPRRNRNDIPFDLHRERNTTASSSVGASGSTTSSAAGHCSFADVAASDSEEIIPESTDSNAVDDLSDTPASARRTTHGPHDRYAIEIVGHSPAVYAVLHDGDKDGDRLGTILSRGSEEAMEDRLMREHPRQGEMFKDAVRKMKVGISSRDLDWGVNEDEVGDDDDEEESCCSEQTLVPPERWEYVSVGVA